MLRNVCDQVPQLSLFELPALSFEFEVNLFRYHGNFIGNRRKSKCPLLKANISRILVTSEFFLSNFHKCEKRARKIRERENKDPRTRERRSENEKTKIRERERENEDPRTRRTPPRAKVRFVRLGLSG